MSKSFDLAYEDAKKMFFIRKVQKFLRNLPNDEERVSALYDIKQGICVSCGAMTEHCQCQNDD